MRLRFASRRGIVIASAVAVALAVLAGCRSARPEYQAAASVPAPVHARPSTAVVVAPAAPTVTVIQPDLAYYAPPVTSWRGAAGKTVILDAGHGGHDTGARHYGLQEKDINLDLTLRTANLLRSRGCNVVLTRSADAFVPLPERSAIANRYPNAVFVSIHVNATENNPAVCGIETFVLSSGQPDPGRGQTAAARFRAQGMDAMEGRQALANLATQSSSRAPALASSLQRTLCGRLGEPDRGVKQKNLAVLRETYFGPAALVEVGFMSNPRSAAQMNTEDWRRRTSEALCDGITGFLGQM